VLFIVLLARLFGPEVTGMFLLSRAALDILSKFGAVGLERSLLSLLSRYVTTHEWKDAYRIIGQFLFVGSIVTGGLVLLLQLFANPLAEALYHNNDFSNALRVLSITAIFYFFTSLFLSTTRAMRIMHYEVITKSIVEPFLLLIFSIIVYFLGWGFEGLCIALMLSSIVGSCLAIYFFSKYFSILRALSNIFNFYQLKSLVHYTTPIGLQDVMTILLQRVDLFLVDRLLSPTAVGIYGVAQEIASVLKAPKQSFIPIFIPVISQAYERNDRNTMEKQYQNVSRWLMLISIGVFGFMIVAMKPIIALFGPEFFTAAGVVYLIGTAFVLNGIMGIGESVILIKRPGINLSNTFLAVLINLLLGSLFITQLGIYGAALGALCAFAALNIARVLQVNYFEGIQPFTRHHTKGLLAAIIPGVLMVSIVQNFTLPLIFHVIAGALFLLTYLGILVKFALATEDRQVLQALFAQLRQQYKPTKFQW